MVQQFLVVWSVGCHYSGVVGSILVVKAECEYQTAVFSNFSYRFNVISLTLRLILIIENTAQVKMCCRVSCTVGEPLIVTWLD